MNATTRRALHHALDQAKLSQRPGSRLPKHGGHTASKSDDKLFQLYGIVSAGFVKIGVTRDVYTRLRQYETHSPVGFDLVFRAPGTYELEGALHRKLRSAGYHYKGEWFFFDRAVRSYLADLERLLIDAVPTEDRWLYHRVEAA